MKVRYNFEKQEEKKTNISFEKDLSTFLLIVFLDAFSHLHKRLCPSVRLWVRPSHMSWNHVYGPFLNKIEISKDLKHV